MCGKSMLGSLYLSILLISCISFDFGSANSSGEEIEGNKMAWNNSQNEYMLKIFNNFANQDDIEFIFSQKQFRYALLHQNAAKMLVCQNFALGFAFLLMLWQDKGTGSTLVQNTMLSSMDVTIKSKVTQYFQFLNININLVHHLVLKIINSFSLASSKNSISFPYP